MCFHANKTCSNQLLIMYIDSVIWSNFNESITALNASRLHETQNKWLPIMFIVLIMSRRLELLTLNIRTTSFSSTWFSLEAFLPRRRIHFRSRFEIPSLAWFFNLFVILSIRYRGTSRAHTLPNN